MDTSENAASAAEQQPTQQIDQLTVPNAPDGGSSAPAPSVGFVIVK